MMRALMTFLATVLVVCRATMQWHLHGEYHAIDPVFTPYYANGSVNLEVIPAYARLSAKNQADVVLLGGSTAEWPSLTSDERLALLSAWRSAIDALPAKQRPQLLFHAGDVSIAKAQHLASQSESRGADAILIVSPCIMRPATLPDLVSSIREIAKYAPKLPALYYHYPEVYGVDFKMDEFSAAAAKAIPTFAGVKYIDPDMKTLTSATGVDPKLTFFNNGPVLAGMEVGSKGAMLYTTLFPLSNKMYAAFKAHDHKLAQDLQRKIFKYEDIIQKYGNKAGARALPEIFDAEVKLGAPRAPLTGLPESEIPKMRQDLIDAGFLSGSTDTVLL